MRFALDAVLIHQKIGTNVETTFDSYSLGMFEAQQHWHQAKMPHVLPSSPLVLSRQSHSHPHSLGRFTPRTGSLIRVTSPRETITHSCLYIFPVSLSLVSSPSFPSFLHSIELLAIICYDQQIQKQKVHGKSPEKDVGVTPGVSFSISCADDSLKSDSEKIRSCRS